MATDALSAVERQRVYEEEEVRVAARRDIRRARLLRFIGVLSLICFGAIAVYKATRPDPVEEIMREYNITKGALKDGETVLLGVRSILLEGESKWNNQTEKKRKDDCSAFLRILDSAEERVDALRDERFRTRAQEFLKQTRRSLFDGLPCGPVLAPK
jgi:hypothetical protein